ncbi:hypothetical protein ACET3Z_019848 [Daucus carota]
MESENCRKSIVMLPHLAHGHISPFLELAKQLAKRSFVVHLCSSPINLASIKSRVHENDHVQLVEFHLPYSPELPPCYHSTNGLPYSLIPTLEQAFEKAAPVFIDILRDIEPDLVIYDFKPSWPAEVALSLNVPAVYFAVTAAAASCLVAHLCKRAGEEFPFPEVGGVSIDAQKLPEPVLKAFRENVLCFERSCSLAFIRSFREVEEKYINFLPDLVQKSIIPIGPLVHDPTDNEDDEMKNIIKWLDRKERSSVLFVCFGSENYLSAEQVIEMSNALEIAKCAFIWSVRLVVEIGVGMAIARNTEGKFKREEIANVINKVLAEESGEGVRRKAREIKLKIEGKGEDDLDKAAEELKQVCSKKTQAY